MRALVDFCTVDLSALYLDVRKDRLYCDPAALAERRATQTRDVPLPARAHDRAGADLLLHRRGDLVAHAEARRGDPDSVHLVLLGSGDAGDARGQRSPRWSASCELRARVQKELEPFRAQKKSSLDAHVTITVPPPTRRAHRTAPRGWLADFFIVSQMTVKLGASRRVVVADATGNRCERCWKWTAAAAALCARCQRGRRRREETA